MPKPVSLAGARRPPSGRATPRQHIRTAITDPAGDKVVVLRNRATDILELERSHGRISGPAYEAGRKLQQLLELAARTAGSSWRETDRVDAAHAHETIIVAKIEDARAISKTMDTISRHLGVFDSGVLRQIIGDRMTFGDIAIREGKCGDRGSNYIGQRFRHALELLAGLWAQPAAKEAC